jgi:hypothetical protein
VSTEITKNGQFRRLQAQFHQEEYQDKKRYISSTILLIAPDLETKLKLQVFLSIDSIMELILSMDSQFFQLLLRLITFIDLEMNKLLSLLMRTRQRLENFQSSQELLRRFLNLLLQVSTATNSLRKV